MKRLNFNPLAIIWASFVISLLIVFLSNSLLLSHLGYDDSQPYTVASIFNYLTGPGRLDDFFNPIYLSNSLPNKESSFVLTPALIYIARFQLSAPIFYLLFFIFSGFYIWFLSLRKYFSWIDILPLILSYPIIFTLCRGNYEFIISGIVFYAVSLIINRSKSYALPILLIGIAVSLKPSALLFFLLIPIKDLIKKYYIFIIIGLINIGLIYLINSDPISYFTDMGYSLKLYYRDYVIGGGGSFVNNSLYGILKITTLYYCDFINTSENIRFEYISQISKFSNIICTSIACISLLIAFLAKDKLKLVGVICILTVLTPSITADYKLLYILIYLSLLAYYIIINKEFSKNTLLIILLLVIIPKHFIFITYFRGLGEFFTLQSIINPILLLIALAITLSSNFSAAPPNNGASK